MTIKKKKYLSITAHGRYLLDHLDSPIKEDWFPVKRSKLLNSMSMKDKYLDPRSDPRFPTAKYVVIVKTYQSPNKYILRGIARQRRKYVIGIMTQDNRFYMNYVVLGGFGITSHSHSLLTSVMTRGFNYNMATMIVMVNFEDKIRDPIEIFVSIIESISNCQVKRRKFLDMASYVNREMKIIGRTHKMSKFRPQWAKVVMKKLYDEGMLSFMSKNPEAYDLVKSYLEYNKRKVLFNGEIEIAMGIIFLYALDISPDRRDIKKKIQELQRKKLLTEKDMLVGTLLKEIETGENDEAERHAEEHTEIDGSGAPGGFAAGGGQGMADERQLRPEQGDDR